MKKVGLELTFSNFRPVSNLHYISKLTEKAAALQFMNHVKDNCLFPIWSSAYLQYHSTETALVKVHSDVALSMDKQMVTMLVLLDLSAAFDTVNHLILLKLLQQDFGIDGVALQWFESYLSNRSQQVSSNGTLSKKVKLECGVPQGSCLGPLLFSAYASSLAKVVSRHLPYTHTYADDTQLYLSFRPSDDATSAESITAMENCISDIRQWMLSYKLKINDSKTEFIMIGTPHQLEKLSFNSIRVGESEIQCVDQVRDLGVILDKHMDMNMHIDKICKVGYFKLYKLKQIRKCLTRESIEALVHAYISSQLDYCNALLYNLYDYQYDRLQKLQNAAARLIIRIPIWHHITPVLKELHWLPVKCRVDFKILLLVYKGLNGMAPKYISDMLVPVEKAYSLRSYKVLKVPRTDCKTLGDSSFAYAGPKLWNGLPDHIKSSKSLDIFKSKLKTQLFNYYYNA